MNTSPPVLSTPSANPGSNGTPHRIHVDTVSPATLTIEDVRRLALTHLRLILACVLLSALCGAAAYAITLKCCPRYTATALLEVKRVQVVNPVTDKTSELQERQLDIELRTQARLLSEKRLFSDVLKNNAKVRETQWIKQFERVDRSTAKVTLDIALAKEQLEEDFSAATLQDSALILIRMAAAQPEDARVILEAIVTEHLRQQREELENSQMAQTKTLRELARTLGGRINELSDRIRKRQTDLLREGLAAGPGIFSTREMELKAIVESRMRLADNAAQAKAAYDEAVARINSGQTLLEVEKVIQTDATLASLGRELASMEIQRDMLVESLGADHPNAARAARSARLGRQMLDARTKELRDRFQTQYLESLKSASLHPAEQLKIATDQVRQLKDALAELSKEIPSLVSDQAEDQHLRDLRDQVEGRLRDIEVAQGLGSPLRIGWASKPETPDTLSFPKLKIFLPAAVLAGLAMAAGIIALREYLNRTIRSPRDLTRIGQPEVLGIVADASEDLATVPSRLAIVDAPHSLMAEQFRQLRARFRQTAANDLPRTILVTGASPSSGKTTIATNIAAALALGGHRVLLVDANFRKPRIHTVFDVPGQRGFGDILGGCATLQELACSTRVPNLSILPNGDRVLDAADMIESGRMTAFTNQALLAYDYLVFDAAPILIAAESVAMASRVAGVITVVRGQMDTLGQLQRMRDLLAQLKAKHIGTVLNGVRAQPGGYYRGTIKTHYNYRRHT